MTLAWVLEHPRWGRIALPLLARLYVRDKDLDQLDPEEWPFRTKLELAGDLICWLRQRLGQAKQPVWLCTDGFYAKREVMDCCRKKRVVLFSRLRRDAAIYSVPSPQRRRGRPRTYGPDRLSLAKRAGQRRGWETAPVMQYGKVQEKTFKTFCATWRPARGVIRVVLVQETTGSQFFFCTDPQVRATTILEVMAARSSIEQTFKDLKEIQGAGQQQVRNVWANVGAFHCCCWAFVIVEWWAWNRPHEQICDRTASVWDDPERRPSHQDRRRALQRESLREELMHWTIQGADQQKMHNRLLHWIRLWT